MFGFWKRRGIPGPTPYPIVGTIFTENYPVTGKEVEKVFREKYGPVYGTFAGTLPVFNTAVPEHIKHVLMNPEIFNQSGVFTANDDYLIHALFFTNGAKWKANRTAMSHHFTSGKLRSLVHYFKGVTKNFLDNVEELISQNGEKAIEAKELFKCYGIDCISKFIFATDVNSFKDK